MLTRTGISLLPPGSKPTEFKLVTEPRAVAGRNVQSRLIELDTIRTQRFSTFDPLATARGSITGDANRCFDSSPSFRKEKRIMKSDRFMLVSL